MEERHLVQQKRPNKDHEIKANKCTCGKPKMPKCHFIHGGLSNGLPNTIKMSRFHCIEVCNARAPSWHSVGNWYVNPPSLTNKEGPANLKYEEFPKCDMIACNGLIKLRSSFVFHWISPHQPHPIDWVERMFIVDNNKYQDLDVDWINKSSLHLET